MKVDEKIKDNISSGIDRAQTFITAQMAKEQDMLEHGKMPKTMAAIVRISCETKRKCI
ncbi:hypothetical protein LGL08_07080 [Clostridium estertheticum]|nr:hypothetical protein [Clostridium estertheticum]MCB2344407.1 hypothetical protein [Clostridium estertheticum]MCB2349326.1 hypothetical protein [Clostridium estertheticum]